MNFPLRPTLVSLTLAFLSAGSAHADITLASLFTDYAVLQRDKPVPIWGRGDVGEKVTVSFAEQRREATVGYDGRWLVILDPLPSTTTGAELSVAGKNTIVLRDVVVGDVWLCAGDANMEWPLSRAAEAANEIAAANFPLIRQLKIERAVSETPLDIASTSGWQPATPQNTGAFTAVGYFFARDLQQRVAVPIGIINTTCGDTPVEAWMSPAALASDPAFAVVQERWRQNVAEFPSRKSDYETRRAAWLKAEADAKTVAAAKVEAGARSRPPLRLDATLLYHDWLRENPRPAEPRGPGDPWTPCGLFNGMINPLLPGAIRGALWSQGESNADRAADYHALFAAMIKAWRSHFGQDEFPFYWVNLAGSSALSGGLERGRGHAFLREAQTKTLVLSNTAQAIAIDLRDGKDVHLHLASKQEIGRRLALLARNRIYGIFGDDTGPIFASATREGAAMRVRFTHASGGLVAHDKPVQALELAGVDRVFHPAEARIERDTLLVMSPAVREPVAVRYAWLNAPEANLYNGAGLPAAPFRSDDW